MKTFKVDGAVIGHSKFLSMLNDCIENEYSDEFESTINERNNIEIEGHNFLATEILENFPEINESLKQKFFSSKRKALLKDLISGKTIKIFYTEFKVEG